jgi:uncharacterized RDD family membrane protein YckC
MDFNDYREEPEDLFVNEPQLVPASHGKRLVNYVVDQLTCIFLILFIMLAIRSTNLALGDAILARLTTGFAGNLTITFFYALFMSIQESLLGGKTLGKLITRTRAVEEDGSRLSAEKAFLRNLIRCVPFNPLSALGRPARPWHDRWSHTMVVDEDQSTAI